MWCAPQPGIVVEVSAKTSRRKNGGNHVLQLTKHIFGAQNCTKIHPISDETYQIPTKRGIYAQEEKDVYTLVYKLSLTNNFDNKLAIFSRSWANLENFGDLQPNLIIFVAQIEANTTNRHRIRIKIY